MRDSCGRTDCVGSKACEEPGCEALHPNVCGSDPAAKGWRCPRHVPDLAVLGVVGRVVITLTEERDRLRGERDACYERIKELEEALRPFAEMDNGADICQMSDILDARAALAKEPTT